MPTIKASQQARTSRQAGGGQDTSMGGNVVILAPVAPEYFDDVECVRALARFQLGPIHEFAPRPAGGAASSLGGGREVQ
jgi:hypothetical protein